MSNFPLHLLRANYSRRKENRELRSERRTRTGWGRESFFAIRFLCCSLLHAGKKRKGSREPSRDLRPLSLIYYKISETVPSRTLSE